MLPIIGFVSLLWLFQGNLVAAFVVPLRPPSSSRDQQSILRSSNNQEQTFEALRSLVDFHEGKWTGKARSFSVVPDTAAGIVQRKTFPYYELSVKLGLHEKMNKDYSLTETFLWDNGNKIKPRSVALSDCNLDVDAVDASYSLDVSLPDLPSEIIGTDELSQFAIEHCIVASENKRMRCFILYGMDQKLQRVVVCDETRSGTDDSRSKLQPRQQSTPGENLGLQLSAKDFLEMESDTDRLVDKIVRNMETTAKSTAPSPKQNDGSLSNYSDATSQTSAESLFAKLGQSISSSDDNSRELTPHDLTLLEISSGIWLGDAIIRNNAHVSDGTTSLPGRAGSGFGAKVSSSASSQQQQQQQQQPGLASWSVGVQKLAWRLMWNFGEEIRHVVDAGKALGDTMAACLSSQSISGSVCVNESLSRRMVKEDRMVYVDWGASNSVGFLVGPMYIYVPRYLNFEQKRPNSGNNGKPFFTEFALCQSTKGDERSMSSSASLPPSLGADEMMIEENLKFPELCLSKSSRVYNHEGRLKQGCTSFFTFKRFGVDDLDG